MSLIHIDLCHQVYWYGGRRGFDTLYVSDDNRGGPINNALGGPDCIVEI